MNKSYQIVLVGGQLLPIYLGVKEFVEDDVVLLVSKETQAKVGSLKKLIAGRSVKEVVCSPYDFNAVYNTLDKLIKTYKKDDKIKINLTGGTKVMLLAAQKIMTEVGLSGFYINQNHSYLEVPSFNIQTLTTSLSIDEYFGLSGHQIAKYNLLMHYDKNDVTTAKDLFEFSNTRFPIYSKVSSFLYKLNKNNFSPATNDTLSVNSNIAIKYSANNVAILDGGKLVFNRSSKNIINLFFNTGWWELFVAKHLEGWGKVKEMYLQVELPFKGDSSQMKNEIDILINLGSKLLFIECKSGMVKAEDVNKMKVIRDTYGGAVAKSILVTKYSPTQSIVEKCNELGIDIFDLYLGKIKKNEMGKLPAFLEKAAQKLSI